MKNNKRHGYGILAFDDGQYYQGEYYNNQEWGEGELSYLINNKLETYKGQFAEGKRCGIGEITLFDQNQQKKECVEYFNNMKHGPQINSSNEFDLFQNNSNYFDITGIKQQTFKVTTKYKFKENNFDQQQQLNQQFNQNHEQNQNLSQEECLIEVQQQSSQLPINQQQHFNQIQIPQQEYQQQLQLNQQQTIQNNYLVNQSNQQNLEGTQQNFDFLNNYSIHIPHDNVAHYDSDQSSHQYSQVKANDYGINHSFNTNLIYNSPFN